MRRGFVFGLLLVSGSSAANPIEDPTRPPNGHVASSVVKTKVETAPKLASVLVAPGRRVAVIDGETFSEGETHGAITVRKIEHDWVDVVVAGRGDLRLLLRVPGLTKEERSR